MMRLGPPSRARIREPEFVAPEQLTVAESVGVDVAKHKWCVGAEGKIQHARNEPRGVAQLVRQLVALDPARIVVESTGGYERTLVTQLAEAGLPVVVVNPRRVRGFGQGMGILAETDALDARLLALFGEKVEPPVRPILQGRARLLADLVARRRQLVSMVVAEKSRRETAAAAVRRSIEAMLRMLGQQVRALDRRIDQVGPGVARTLLVDLPELGHLGRREIASLVGVAPSYATAGRSGACAASAAAAPPCAPCSTSPP
jgi:transposase